jgi:hypothetical protein
MDEWNEVVQIIEHLQAEFQDLVVRGLRTVGPQHLASLETIRQELQRINADHLADRIQCLVEAIRDDRPDAAAAVLQAQTSLRLFQRMLTLDVAASTLETMLAADEGGGDP